MGTLDERHYKDFSGEYFFERLWLLESAVRELAELLGDSSKKPISASLFCLEHGLTIDDRGKIIMLLNRLLSENDELEYTLLKKYLIESVPKLECFADEVLLGMISIFKKTYVAEED
ncbi:hypothetical protein [Streptococcus sciuri]|uniref:Uncharacterized protein n=1 Tax=Streptococcus sciuri TaxID=2973939 RepID=A0ABT2F8N2_9STRE|nr:hypothetical protein [Streptococcus sciuri]MCS4488774.1 hypothetical protein [Streptococcus sciuri]